MDREEIAMLLMDAGADIDALPGECWSTPLHLAVHFSFFATVEELLKRSAMIDVFIRMIQQLSLLLQRMGISRQHNFFFREGPTLILATR